MMMLPTIRVYARPKSVSSQAPGLNHSAHDNPHDDVSEAPPPGKFLLG